MFDFIVTPGVTIKVDNANDVKKKVIQFGGRAKGTYELVNTTTVIRNSDFDLKNRNNWKKVGAHIEDVEKLIFAVMGNNNAYVSDLYNSMYYTPVMPQICMAKDIITKDPETRQCYIVFPRIHCFESIQVITRGDRAYVTINMRSCNAVANYASDLYLGFLMARYMAPAISDPDMIITLTCNIGSLHVFDEEVRS